MRFLKDMLRLAFGCVLLGITGLFADIRGAKKSKGPGLKLTQKYALALDQMEKNNVQAAEVMLKEIIAEDTMYLEPLMALAHIYKQRKQYAKTIDYLDRLFEKNAEVCRDCYYDYAIAWAGLGKFKQAQQAIDYYLSDSTLHPELKEEGLRLKANYDFAIQYEKENKLYLENYKFYPKNMGNAINSQYSEYFPTLNFDGTTIYFTRRLYHRNEDFFESDFDEEDSVWTPAKPLPGSVNTELNEGTQSVSLDEEWLAFTGCDFPNGLGSCDLYFSAKKGGRWDSPHNMGHKVNSEFWESQPAFSPDKRSIYFAAKLPDGYGGSDIYVTYLDDNGEWSYPQNLGPVINTAGDETSPFIHSDNETMYFTSNGHQGYGGMDIFKASRDRSGKWGQVKNLGYPINTIENENCLFINSDGKTAYYASDRSDSYGGLDIYTFELRAGIRPKETYWVKIQVGDRERGKILPSSLNVIDMEYNAMTIHPILTEDTSYLVALVAGRRYFLATQAKGYFYNYEISFRQPNDTPLVRHKTVFLDPLQPQVKMAMNQVFFDFDRYTLKANSIAELNTALMFLKLNDKVRVRISGHTDNKGDAGHNLMLSENRARAVYHFFVDRGIVADRLEVLGFGSTQPIASNATEEGRALNRRTELEVIGWVE